MGDRSGTIVAAVIKRFVAATVTIWLVAKLIGCPDCAFHGEWRILWRSCFAKTKTRGLARHNRSKGWKKIGYCWNDPRENSDAEQDSMTNRTDRFPPGSCRMPKKLRMKRKIYGSAAIRELKKQITSLAATLKEQAAQIENVSNQIQLNRRTAQLVNNEP
jgi:hypothetical protein